MAGNEPVVAPDQLKVRHYSKVWRISGIISAIALFLMTIGNHHGQVENIWLVGIGLGIIGIIIADGVMRRRGLKR